MRPHSFDVSARRLHTPSSDIVRYPTRYASACTVHWLSPFIQTVSYLSRKNKEIRSSNLDFKLSSFFHIFLPIFSFNFSLFQLSASKNICFLTQHALIPFVNENSKNRGSGLSLLIKRTSIELGLTHNKTPFRLPHAFSPRKDYGCGDCSH